MRKLLGGLTCMILVLGTALPAFGGQLEASNRPQKSGPLSYDGAGYGGPDCQSEKARFEGEVVARYQTCSFFYRFDSAFEGNAERDFGALWLQTEVDPEHGWCASEVTAKLELRGGSARVQEATERTASPSGSKKITAKLRVDAAGGATEPGKLRNDFKLYPGEFSSDFRGKNDRLRIRWDGATQRTVALAGGIALSWRVDEGPPPIAIDIDPVMQDRC